MSQCRNTRLPQLEPVTQQFLTAEEIARVATAVPDRHRALVLAAVFTGLRFAELAALRTERLDLDTAVLRVVETQTESPVGSMWVNRRRRPPGGPCRFPFPC